MSSAGRPQSRNLVLAAMIFAVSMTFIDQTIVSIAAPTIQRELGLTATGVQWAINAYLLSLAALFAFGGRLADTVGHRKMVTLGVIVFAGASAMCGLTPKGGLAEAWLVTFRVVQGAGGAIMFPAALAIVVQTFPLHQRGKALALFFGIAGGLTAIGPALGGVPHAMDLARDLLGEHSGRDRRADPDLHLEAGDRTSPRPDGLPRARADRVRCRTQHLRLPTVGAVGLDRSEDVACMVVGAALLVVVLPVRRVAPLAADRGKHLPDPPVPRREPRARDLEHGLHPGVLLRQRVRADLARQVARRSRAWSCCTSSSGSSSRRRSAGACSTASARSARS